MASTHSHGSGFWPCRTVRRPALMPHTGQKSLLTCFCSAATTGPSRRSLTTVLALTTAMPIMAQESRQLEERGAIRPPSGMRQEKADENTDQNESDCDL